MPLFLQGLDKLVTVQWMSISSSLLPNNCPYSIPKVGNKYTFVHALIWGKVLPAEGAGKLGDVWVSTLEENLGVWVCRQGGSWVHWPGNKGFDVDGRDPYGVHPYLKDRYLWFTGTTFLWNKAGSIRASKCRWNQKIADQSNTDWLLEAALCDIGPEDAVTAWIAVGPGKKRKWIRKTEGRVLKKQRLSMTSVVAGPSSGPAQLSWHPNTQQVCSSSLCVGSYIEQLSRLWNKIKFCYCHCHPRTLPTKARARAKAMHQYNPSPSSVHCNCSTSCRRRS
jgi:hypothetical protein